MNRARLVVGLTHPVQYYSPWFRYLTKEIPEIDLHVVYATLPNAEQQSAGFGQPFSWDVPLLEGYSYEVVRSTRSRDRLGSFWGLLSFRFPHVVFANRPDAVLLPGWNSATLALAIVSGARRRVPLLYRGDSTLKSSSRRLAHLTRARASAFIRCFDAYLAVGTASERYLKSFGVKGSNIFKSPHFVDNEYFAERAEVARQPLVRAARRRQLGLDPEAFTAIFAGKLTKNKRAGDLIIAAARTSAACLVVGSGEEEAQLRSLAAETGGACSFAGFVNQSEIGGMYALADCFVLPSDSETWGLAANEAMAAGLPVILSSGVGAAEDLIEEGRTGYMFETGDINALCKALNCVKTRSEAMSVCAAKKIEQFSTEAATEGLLASIHYVRRGRASTIGAHS